ncbi:MAG: restriction endonuclease subunit S [Alphaproteobacteria bacterium]|jgi:type I restriction enzyme S subunit|nr:restriction endonuclease subunit S [Alphaproteobacteria bacterium]
MKPTDALPHPDDWKTAVIGNAADIKRGVSWSKDQEHTTPYDGAIPVIGISNVQYRLELDNLLYLSGLKPKAIEQKRVEKGWSVMVGSNGNRQRIGNAVYIDEDAEFLFASFLIAAKPKADSGILPEFFFRWLRSEHVQAYLSASSEGSTGLSNLSHSFFRKMTIAYPEEPEQAAIARVLDAVDKAIDRAHIAIEKAQVTRLALMQAAFHYEMTSEPKHDTDAGRIPRSWEALKGRQAFTVLTGGNSSVHALKPLRGDDVADAWFMKVDDFNLPANLRQIVTTQIGFVADKNPSFKLLPLGTIIIAKRGAAILKNRVRTAAVPVALDPNLMALKVRDDILPDFFRYQLEWRNLARYIESSGVPQLNNKDLYPRWFVRAPEEQQQEIVVIISAAEQHEDALHSKLTALESLKKSLMHDLLTGTMRVDPKLFKELEAS